jgi:hypothetical protein
MRLTLLIIGIVGVIYILGSAITGQFGFAIVLSYPTAWITGMSQPSAEVLWTLIYIGAIIVILILAFVLEGKHE